MRKWTMSACVALAWCLLALAAIAGTRGPDHPAQASTSTATSISNARTSNVTSGTVTRTSTAASASASTSTAAGTSLAAGTRTADAASVVLASESASVVLASESVAAVSARVTPAPAAPAATWTVRSGDTLSAIAAALRVPGGWPALYAGNRRVVGPDPNVIRAATVLAVPRPAAPLARPRSPQSAAPAPARTRHQSPPPAHAPVPAPVTAPPASLASPATTPAGRQPAGHPAAPGSATVPGQATTVPGHAAVASTGGMPRWLLDLLLAAGVLAATAFIAEPAAVLARRRRHATGPPARNHAPGAPRDLARHAVGKARIIFADHERLIVTYCANDHAVYVLTPPGENPRAVLRAARLILPEDTYEDLAGHLGVPSAWPME